MSQDKILEIISGVFILVEHCLPFYTIGQLKRLRRKINDELAKKRRQEQHKIEKG